MSAKKHSDFIIVLIVAATYNSIYSLAYMKSLYYTLMQSGLSLSHFRLGQLYSAYGIFAMFSYLCGAFFLNRFARWKLLFGSSALIGVLTLSLLLMPPYPVMFVIFGVTGFILGAVFYPTHLEILHQLGGELRQGTIFSMFFVCNSVIGVIFSVIGLSVSSLDFSDPARVRLLFILFAALNMIAAVLAVTVLRKLPDEEIARAPFSFHKIKELLQNKKLWMVTIIVFVNYLAFANTSYIPPYLTETFDFSPALNNLFSLFRVYFVGIIVAPIGGKITDRLHSASRLLSYTFLVTILCAAGAAFTSKLPAFQLELTLVFLILMCIVVVMGKSMALVTIDEAGITPAMYGMAISFISFSAYSPDAFYYSLCGGIIDSFNTKGYDYIFLLTALCSFIGLWAVHNLHKAD